MELGLDNIQGTDISWVNRDLYGDRDVDFFYTTTDKDGRCAGLPSNDIENILSREGLDHSTISVKTLKAIVSVKKAKSQVLVLVKDEKTDEYYIGAYDRNTGVNLIISNNIEPAEITEDNPLALPVVFGSNAYPHFTTVIQKEVKKATSDLVMFTSNVARALCQV